MTNSMVFGTVVAAALGLTAAMTWSAPVAAGPFVPNVQVRNPGGGTLFSSTGSVALNITYVKDGKSNAIAVAAGTFALEWRQGTSGPWTELLTYCLEPDELIGIGNKQSTTYAGQLVGRTADTAEYKASANAISALFNKYYEASLLSKVAGAALQVALWEVAYDTSGTYSLATGDFMLNTYGGSSKDAKAVAALAATYLGYLATPNLDPGDAVGVILRVGNQDLVIKVPEPATLALFGVGLAALGVAWRRRSRRATAA